MGVTCVKGSCCGHLSQTTRLGSARLAAHALVSHEQSVAKDYGGMKEGQRGRVEPSPLSPSLQLILSLSLSLSRFGSLRVQSRP